MTPQTMMEAWFRLMKDAVGGNAEAQEAMRMLTSGPTNPDQMMRWMSRFLPLATGGMTPVKTDVFENWLDEYWRMMGVVPRYRYLELLERHEALRSRLEESEKTVRQLQGMLGVPGHQREEAQKVIGLWGEMMHQTMKAQLEWMQALTGMAKEREQKPADQSASTSESKASEN